MNPPRDEIRRQLRAARVEQRRSLPRSRAELRRSFDPDGPVSGEQRAQLLGLRADRRGFLRVGGMTVALGALAAACADSPEEPISLTGSTPPPPDEPPTVTIPSSEERDRILVRTAGSVEASIIDVYDELTAEGLVEDQTALDALGLFTEHHREHAELLAELAAQVGTEPFDEPNEHLAETFVAIELDAVRAQEGADQQMGALSLAYEMETIATHTYTMVAGQLTTADHRRDAMSIGGVEARHIAVLLGLLGDPQAPFALSRTAEAIPDEGLIHEA